MKLFKRKTATFQDYINFAGIVLFIWVIITKTVVIGSISEMFVMENALVLTCIGVLLEMLSANLSLYITDFKNWRYDVRIEKKKYKGESQDEEKE